MTNEDREKLLAEYDKVVPRNEILTRMPYGKYKGVEITKLPNWYLGDLARNEYLWDNLRPAVDAELVRRIRTPRQVQVG